jgi:hypothetical protein
MPLLNLHDDAIYQKNTGCLLRDFGTLTDWNSRYLLFSGLPFVRQQDANEGIARN